MLKRITSAKKERNYTHVNLFKSFNVICLLILLNYSFASSALGSISASKKLFDMKSYSDVNVNEFKFLIDKIFEFHIDPPAKKDVVLNAVNGVLYEMDPHSMLFDKEEFKDLMERVDGEFGGIGIEMEWRKGVGIFVLTAIDDLPAEVAGIKSNDIIVEINGESVDELGWSKSIHNLRGTPGTKVKVRVLRLEENGMHKKLDFTITRAIIKAESVKYFIDNDIVYIRISAFDKNTFDEFKKVATRLKACGIKGILLDLTNNSGGVIDPANKIVDMLISSGKIVSIKGKGSEIEHVANTNNTNKLLDIPIVVMINEFTASAAEIMAAALQDHHRAIIIGRKSFGKGSVQTVFKLNENYGIKITTALHYRPNGKTIQGKGVDPDIIIKKTKVKHDVEEEENVDDYFRPSEASYRTHIKPKDDDNEQTSKKINVISDEKARKISKDQAIERLIDLEEHGSRLKNQKTISKKCNFDDPLIKNQYSRAKLERFIEKNMYTRGFDVLQGLIISNLYKEDLQNKRVD